MGPQNFGEAQGAKETALRGSACALYNELQFMRFMTTTTRRASTRHCLAQWWTSCSEKCKSAAVSCVNVRRFSTFSSSLPPEASASTAGVCRINLDASVATQFPLDKNRRS